MIIAAGRHLMKRIMIINGYNKQLLLLFIISVFFIGCRNEDIVEDENKFAAIYVDLVIVNETYQGDSLLINSRTDSVFNAHGVTEKQYRSTIEYYQQDPERWEQFFEKADSYLREKKKKNKI